MPPSVPVGKRVAREATHSATASVLIRPNSTPKALLKSSLTCRNRDSFMACRMSVHCSDPSICGILACVLSCCLTRWMNSFWKSASGFRFETFRFPRLKQYIPLERCYPPTKLHGVTVQETTIGKLVNGVLFRQDAGSQENLTKFSRIKAVPIIWDTGRDLTLYLLMWKTWWAPNNASKG